MALSVCAPMLVVAPFFFGVIVVPLASRRMVSLTANAPPSLPSCVQEPATILNMYDLPLLALSA